MPYPTLTSNLHYEAELVVAISKGGKNIKPENAEHHIYGYAVGLDMTRRDLQAEMKKKQWPWSIGKGFDFSAPMGPITIKEEAGDVGNAEIYLQVNGVEKQRSSTSKFITGISEIIHHISLGWELQPGDLIFTGTPEGVGPVVPGDLMTLGVTGLSTLNVRVEKD